MNIRRIQKRLDRVSGGRVKAEARGAFVRLTGEADTWDGKVEAGRAAVGRGYRVVNDVACPEAAPPARLPDISDTSLDGLHVDALVIGAGVVGAATARELTRRDISVLIIDKEYDVGLHASSRNDGMVHPGIDIPPGMLKKRLNRRGNRMYGEVCRELGVPFDRCGQYLCFRRRMLPVLWLTLPYWALTCPGGARVTGRKRLHELEPGVAETAGCALFFPSAGVVCPYGLTIAYAENAVTNGARLSLDTAVLAMTAENGRITAVKTNRGTVYPRLVINAAGVFADDVAELAGDRFFSIHPRRGTNAILDKKYKRFVAACYSAMGTQSFEAHTKGGGVVSTADGNVLIGPDAKETPYKEDFSTSAASIDGSFRRHARVAPWLTKAAIITYFTGVRAATYEEDFIVERGHAVSNMIHAAGIQSPGLTAAPAIAERVAAMAAADLGAGVNPAFDPIRKPIPRVAALPDDERHALIAEDPDYGEIVCRCEEISRGEILAALRRPVPCRTADGVKRRVRPGMGRCQGGFCGPAVVKLIAREFNIPPESVRKAGPGSEILRGEDDE